LRQMMQELQIGGTSAAQKNIGREPPSAKGGRSCTTV
jgi:hypothetical protein